MKKISVLILFIISSTSFSQLNGNYIIGGASPNYSTITLAVSALVTNGVSGPVVFSIMPGTYIANSYNITNVNGTSSLNTVTFEPFNPSGLDVILTPTVNTGTIFNVSGNSSFIKFKRLKFGLYVSSGSPKRAFSLTNTVSNITIEYCDMEGNTTPSLSSYQSSPTFYTYILLAGNNITIRNNSFSAFGSAISKDFNSTTYSSNIIISNNTFKFGMLIPINMYYAQNLTIDGNIYFNAINYRAINTFNLKGDILISRNHISSTTTESVNQSYMSIYGNTTEVSNLTLINNFINLESNVFINNFTTVKVINNNFLSTDNNCLTVTGSSNLTDYKLFNNVFSSNALNANVVVNLSNINLLQSDKNAFNRKDNIVKYINPNTTFNLYNLDQWKTLYTKDLNSLVTENVYASNSDLHTPNAFMLNGTGLPFVELVNDVDGQIRNNPPDIGADEFDIDTTTYIDLEIESIVSPTNSLCENSSVVLAIKNNSVFPITSFNIESSINSNRGNVTAYNQPILPNETINLSVANCEIVKNTLYERIEFYVSNPNNLMDNNYSNNIKTINNVFQLGDFVINLETNNCNNQKKLIVPVIPNTTVTWSTGQTGNSIIVTQAGIYTATVTDSQNCQVTNSITVN